jgi:hypothetical protein
MGQETRNKLTDYWEDHEIKKEEEYAILTNIIHQEWADVSVKKHKEMKGLKTQNLRGHMSEAELIFTALAELSTRQIAETMKAVGMDENKVAGKKGGGIAKKARRELEEKTGRKAVVSNVNTVMVMTYFEIGRMIVEEEQQGKKRAGYAEETLKKLSLDLTKEFGKGFSERNLRAFQQYYLTYNTRAIWQSPIAKSKNPFHRNQMAKCRLA